MMKRSRSSPFQSVVGTISVIAKPDIAALQACPADQIRVARDWWRDDDARVLPGEESGTTVFVFVVEFQKEAITRRPRHPRLLT